MQQFRMHVVAGKQSKREGDLPPGEDAGPGEPALDVTALCRREQEDEMAPHPAAMRGVRKMAERRPGHGAIVIRQEDGHRSAFGSPTGVVPTP